MKKPIAFFTALLIMVSCVTFFACGGTPSPSISITPSAEQPPSVQPSTQTSPTEFLCEPQGEGYVIVEYFGSAAEIVVPDTYDGLAVVGIGASAFQNNKTLQKITLPQTVTTIENDAFRGCVSLQTATLDGVVSIGANAFDGCLSLRRINQTENCRLIGSKAFYGCTALEEIDLSSAEEIGVSAFEGCLSLKKVFALYQEPTNDSMPEEVDPFLPQPPIATYAIGSRAFFGCSSLQTVWLPLQGCSVVGESAFSGCSQMQTVFLPKTVQLIYKNAFVGCSALQAVYYGGAESDFSAIRIEESAALMQDKVFYYSELAPTKAGNYWYHNYNFYGEPTPWNG